MKKRIIVLGLCAITLLAACKTNGGGKVEEVEGLTLRNAIEKSADKIVEEIPRGSRVAIVAFESANVSLSEYIMEELNGELFDRGIDVVDRQNLAHVLEELNFQMSQYVSEETARSLGLFLGADVVITGQLTGFGNMYRYRTNAINVETAARVSITRFDVQNDRELQRMIEGAQ